MNIRLDGGVQSSLDWKAALAEAASSCSHVTWKLDLGLFTGLKRGLTHPTDFQALLLSLKHFREVVWIPFQDKTEAVILYEGSLDLTPTFPWDDTQEQNLRSWLHERPLNPPLLRKYCLEAAAEYLGLLIQAIPDEIPLRLNLDASSIADPFEKVELLNPARFPRLTLNVQGKGSLRLGDVPTQIALCLPSTSAMAPAVHLLEKKQLPYKLIPEEDLITSWDQLDLLLYDSSTLTPLGKRKLRGFEAAGGQVLDVLTQMPQIFKLFDCQGNPKAS